MTAEPLLQPPPSTTPSPYPTAGHIDDETQLRPTILNGWARIWPSLLAAITLLAVGGPAAVASYRHARDVIAQHGDPVMAPWLALTTVGMILAALVVIWVRRHRREPVRAGPWAAFWAGMAATIAANLDCVAAAAPAATAPGTNGHVPTRVPTSPTPDPRDGSARAGSAPAPASKYRPGTEPTHQTGHSGHHDPVRTGRVPDGDILAWLSEQTATTGKVPDAGK